MKLRRKRSKRTCPLCREELRLEPATPCHGCGTIYHDDCLSELAEVCAVPGCGERVRRQSWPELLELGPEPAPRPRSFPEAPAGPRVDPEQLAARRRQVEESHYQALRDEARSELTVGALVALAIMLVVFVGNGVWFGAPVRELSHPVLTFLGVPPLSALCGWGLTVVADRDGPGRYGPINAAVLALVASLWILGVSSGFAFILAFGLFMVILWPGVASTRAPF